MRLMIVPLFLLVFVRPTFAQPELKKASNLKLYFLTDSNNRSCVYSSESKWESEVQSRRALDVAQVDYVNDRINLICVTKADEAGDWTVYDTYSLDKDERLLA